MKNIEIIILSKEEKNLILAMNNAIVFDEIVKRVNMSEEKVSDLLDQLIDKGLVVEATHLQNT